MGGNLDLPMILQELMQLLQKNVEKVVVNDSSSKLHTEQEYAAMLQAKALVEQYAVDKKGNKRAEVCLEANLVQTPDGPRYSPLKLVVTKLSREMNVSMQKSISKDLVKKDAESLEVQTAMAVLGLGLTAEVISKKNAKSFVVSKTSISKSRVMKLSRKVKVSRSKRIAKAGALEREAHMGALTQLIRDSIQERGVEHTYAFVLHAVAKLDMPLEKKALFKDVALKVYAKEALRLEKIQDIKMQKALDHIGPVLSLPSNKRQAAMAPALQHDRKVVSIPKSSAKAVSLSPKRIVFEEIKSPTKSVSKANESLTRSESTENKVSSPSRSTGRKLRSPYSSAGSQSSSRESSKGQGRTFKGYPGMQGMALNRAMSSVAGGRSYPTYGHSIGSKN